jgi:hypothetical protein
MNRARVRPEDCGTTCGNTRAGVRSNRPGTVLLYSGAPWYDTYATKDGQYVAIGAIELKFYDQLLTQRGLSAESLPDQNDRAGCPALRTSGAAYSKALTLPSRPCSRSPKRRPACDRAQRPRFGRQRDATRACAALFTHAGCGALGREALAEWGFTAEEIDGLAAQGLGFAT